jgi:dTDP-4-amino-4,6-dideoxygalactose transaminase
VTAVPARVGPRERVEIPFLDLDGTTAEVAEEVLDGWRELLMSQHWVGGEEVAAFESAWAAYCGTPHAVGVANGTDALHLALRALGVGPGDEVVVPGNTFVATAEAVLLAGARPRFCDVDPATGLLTAAHVEAVLTPRTRAVAAVHLYGQMPDMDALSATCARHGLLLVEDAAQAQGASWRGVRAGAFGAAGCFSFYPGKNLGAFGDAGAVVTSDPLVAERLRSLRDHGRAAGGHHAHERVGTNSRLDSVQAVVLSAKLARLDSWNASRRRLARLYGDLLPATARPLREAEKARSVHHLMVVRVQERERVRAELAGRGIGTGIHYPTPCHRMAPYRAWADGPLPGVEALGGEIVSLPLFPHLRTGQVVRVCEALAEVTAGSRAALGGRPA